MPRSVCGHPNCLALTAVAMVCAAAPVCGQCQLDKFLPHDSADLDVFGQAIAIDGNHVAIGAPSVSENSNGSAYVFRRVGSIWVQEAVVTASDGAPDDEFGHSVAICGDFLAVGARLDDDNGGSSGSAYVFERIGSQWLQIDKLTPSDAADDDQFGNAIAISCTPDGVRIAVAARQNGDFGTASGSAYVFRHDGDRWIEEAKLLASDGQAWDLFGFSIAMSGDRVVVGARATSFVGDGLGAAYVYTRDGFKWTEEAILSASDEDEADFFGYSVSVNGDLIGVGASNDEENGSTTGAAYLYRFDGKSWAEEQKLAQSDPTPSAGLGFSIFVQDDTVLVGAWQAEVGDIMFAGAAYLFKYTGVAWQETAKLTSDTPAQGEQFGRVLALSGAYAVIGEPFDDDGGDAAGAVYGFGVQGDCDDNGAVDICEIVNNPGLDGDGNGILDVCEPVGDVDGDGDVDINDFLALLAAWGPCDRPCPPSCAADFDEDCQVGIGDFLLLLANWS